MLNSAILCLFMMLSIHLLAEENEKNFYTTMGVHGAYNFSGASKLGYRFSQKFNVFGTVESCRISNSELLNFGIGIMARESVSPQFPEIKAYTAITFGEAKIDASPSDIQIYGFPSKSFRYFDLQFKIWMLGVGARINDIKTTAMGKTAIPPSNVYPFFEILDKEF